MTDGSAGTRQGLTGKRRNPFLVWLVWPIITLGIYHLYWWYKINDEARRLDARIKVSPAVSVLALFPGFLILIPPFVTIYRTGTRIRSMQQAGGSTPSCIPILGLVLSFVFSLQALYYQVMLNELWAHYGNLAPDTSVPLAG